MVLTYDHPLNARRELISFSSLFLFQNILFSRKAAKGAKKVFRTRNLKAVTQRDAEETQRFTEETINPVPWT
ncbi:hypothetical protein DMA11_22810 [Marinilabiliaceae bacterium JC017]|nr:hypothetical protein DMA11_22810 [Marinilabiliaceae bacterium JC017]